MSFNCDKDGHYKWLLLGIIVQQIELLLIDAERLGERAKFYDLQFLLIGRDDPPRLR